MIITLRRSNFYAKNDLIKSHLEGKREVQVQELGGGAEGKNTAAVEDDISYYREHKHVKALDG